MIPDWSIVVRPVPGGWCVQTDQMGELMFLSGAQAEDMARRLAMGLSAAGLDARVDIHDRRNLTVATRRYFAQGQAFAEDSARALG